MDFVELECIVMEKQIYTCNPGLSYEGPKVYFLSDRKAEMVSKCLLNLMWKHGALSRISFS